MRFWRLSRIISGILLNEIVKYSRWTYVPLFLRYILFYIVSVESPINLSFLVIPHPLVVFPQGIMTSIENFRALIRDFLYICWSWASRLFQGALSEKTVFRHFARCPVSDEVISLFQRADENIVTIKELHITVLSYCIISTSYAAPSCFMYTVSYFLSHPQWSWYPVYMTFIRAILCW